MPSIREMYEHGGQRIDFSIKIDNETLSRATEGSEDPLLGDYIFYKLKTARENVGKFYLKLHEYVKKNGGKMILAEPKREILHVNGATIYGRFDYDPAKDENTLSIAVVGNEDVKKDIKKMGSGLKPKGS